MLRRLPFVLLMFLVTATVPACTGDSTGGSGGATLVGSWLSTYLQVRKVSNPNDNIVLSNTGTTIQLDFDADGSYRSIVHFAGELPDTSEGTYTNTKTMLTLHEPGGATNMIGLAFTATTMTISNASLDWDFGSGEEDAYLNGTFAKQ